MRVEICGIKTVQDLQCALQAGADALGFMVGQLHKSPDFILPSTAERLAGELPPLVTPIVVTHLFEVPDILDLIAKTRIHTVQLHGRMSVEKVKQLSDNMPPDGKIILAAYIARGQMPDIIEYYPYISAVLLDAHNRSPELIETEDHNDFFWTQAADFAARCPKPIILSGGLSPDNADEAIRTVKPYGVDANRKLKTQPGGCCSADKCAAFVAAARNAATL